MQVVLPAPLVPTSAKISPARTSRVRSASTGWRPNRLRTPENSIAFVGGRQPGARKPELMPRARSAPSREEDEGSDSGDRATSFAAVNPYAHEAHHAGRRFHRPPSAPASREGSVDVEEVAFLRVAGDVVLVRGHAGHAQRRRIAHPAGARTWWSR